MALTGEIGLESAVLKGIPANILTSVRAASERTGVDFSYLVAKAAAESSFDTRAQASTSSARGLYQFIDQTWLDMVKAHGADYGLGKLASALKSGPLDPQTRAAALSLRDNPRLSAAMAAEYTKDNKETLESALGRDVGSTDLYMAHFLGAQGATKFLSAMDRNASTRADVLFPEAARANRSIFYDHGRPRSVGEIYDRFAGKLGVAPSASPSEVKVADLPPPVQAPLPNANLKDADDDASASGSSAYRWQGLAKLRTFAPPAADPTTAAWANPYSRLSQDAILLLAQLSPPETRKSGV
jgi:Transglycosylase SLT domain